MLAVASPAFHDKSSSHSPRLNPAPNIAFWAGGPRRACKSEFANQDLFELVSAGADVERRKGAAAATAVVRRDEHGLALPRSGPRRAGVHRSQLGRRRPIGVAQALALPPQDLSTSSHDELTRVLLRISARMHAYTDEIARREERLDRVHMNAQALKAAGCSKRKGSHHKRHIDRESKNRSPAQTALLSKCGPKSSG
eukprot:6211065-Pleurochrysis_carterae.AAC.4